MERDTVKTALVIVAIGLGLVACKKKAPDAGGAGSAGSADSAGSAGAAGSAAGGGAVASGPAARKVVKIGAGDGTACAVMDNGTVRCWGKNDIGGRGTEPGTDDAATPIEVPGITDAVDIVMGGDSGSSGDLACVWTKTTKVWCWGSSSLIPNNTAKSLPREVPALEGVVSIALGGGTGYVVKPDGTVWGWGSPAFNALADGTTSGGADKPPTQIAGLAGAKMVSAGQNHGCALLGDGTVSCWGYVRTKQLPTAIAGVAGATYLYSESQRDTSCAVTPTATLCWGESGEAKPVDELKGVTKISGRNHECALAADGSVWCWGSSNEFGELGVAAASAKPTKVAGLSTKAVDLAVGHVYTCAALADGTAACWGYNQRGQLGDGTLMDRAAPTPVAGITLATLPAAKAGQDQVQEGSASTSFDGLPAACKNGPIAITAKQYTATTFPVKAARANVSLGGKTISIELADHNFHKSWGKPRGTQGKLSFRLARWALKDGKRGDALAVDLGDYALKMDAERLVSPQLETKTGAQALISLSLQGVDAGKLTLTHLDDAWVCGELAIAGDGTSVKGPFAAPIVK